MKININICFIIFIFLLGNCKPKSNKYYLTGEDHKLWDFYEPNDTILNSAYLFSKDGSLRYYLYNDQDKLNIFTGFEDIAVCNCWKEIGKDSISLDGFTYKKFYFSENLIILSTPRGRRYILVKSKYPIDKLDLSEENK